MNDTCAIIGCGKPLRYPSRGWCTSHYMRWWQFGDPENHGSQIRGDDVARFWSKVDKGHPSGCWQWTAVIKPDGYGQFRLRGRQVSPHRHAYELLIGLIPDGLVLDHLCRNRGCVNPDHLEPVTQQTNILRGVGPAARNAQKTECKRGHEFTEENTYVTLDGIRRVCRTCMRDNMRRSRARRKGAVT